VKLLVLASRHVHELLTYRECAEVMRAALAARARGQIQQPLRTIVRPRDAAGFMALMPAYAPDSGYKLSFEHRPHRSFLNPRNVVFGGRDTRSPQ